MELKWLLLFDLDATLVRTGGVGMQAMDQAFGEVMHWPGVLYTISLAGRIDPSIAHELSRQQRGCDMTQDELDRVFARYLELLRDYLPKADNYRVLPGIPEFLERMQKRPDILLGLGTGNLEEGAKIKLERANLNHYFSFGGYGTDALERHEVLRIAVKRGEAKWGRPIRPDQVVVIGDTHHDIAAGKSIGAKTIAVATGPFTKDQLALHHPDLVVEDFSNPKEIDVWLQL